MNKPSVFGDGCVTISITKGEKPRIYIQQTEIESFASLSITNDSVEISFPNMDDVRVEEEMRLCNAISWIKTCR
jgi:hypothetical protein